MATTNKMQIHGENMTSVTIIEKILLSMTPKFNYVVRSIKQLKDIEELSIDELHGSMLVYKQKFFQEDKDEQALKASTNNNAAHQINQLIGEEVEEEEEKKMEMEVEVDQAILEMTKINSILKPKVEAAINNMINRRQNQMS